MSINCCIRTRHRKTSFLAQIPVKMWWVVSTEDTSKIVIVFGKSFKVVVRISHNCLIELHANNTTNSGCNPSQRCMLLQQ